MMNTNHRDSDWAALLESVRIDLQRSPPHDEALWLELRRRVRLQALHLIRTSPGLASDVDDVVQDVLLKLQSPAIVARLMTGSPVSGVRHHPGGYVAMMVRNAIVDRGRQQQRDRESWERYGKEHPTSAGTEFEGSVSPETRLRLRRALANLSAWDRRLLRLRFAANMPIQAIAVQQGMNYSAVAVRLFRLMRRLKRDINS